MATEKKHALYLMPLKDGQYGPVELIAADEVEAKRAEGYVDPIGKKANGEEWNAEADLSGQDAASGAGRRKEPAAKSKK